MSSTKQDPETKKRVLRVLQEILEENNDMFITTFAQKLNIPYRTVYKWFYNNYIPRLSYIKKICETFGVSISRFF